MSPFLKLSSSPFFEKRPYFQFFLFLTLVLCKPIQSPSQTLNLVPPQKISSLDPDRIIPIPPPLRPKPLWVGQVFTEDLTEEFQERYIHLFGSLESGPLASDLPSEFGEFYFKGNLQYQSNNQAQDTRIDDYGEYILRRSLEFHLDRYLKGEPNLKPVYKVKDQLTNVRIKMNEKTKVKFKYSISGNYFESTLERSPLEFKITWDFQGGPAAGPSKEVTETIYTFKSIFFKDWTLTNYYRVQDHVAKVILEKTLKMKVNTSLTYSTYTSKTGYSEREKSLIAGLGFNY